MNKDEKMEKMTAEDGKTPNLVAGNVEKMRELFPEIFAEGQIDFEALEQVLGDYSHDTEEHYSFTWHGKSEARRIAQLPSQGTLRPCPEESVNWDETQNIFIEGDNLEVLKLLQKSYHRKVKMIYIDPPYNTGKEFIYPDRFKDNLDTYLKYTGQTDDEGFKLSANSETGGRYHTNWLNMMYPRLRLARNLLKDDGVIFVSIDDNEVVNLARLCDELFGEENRLGLITVVSNLKGRSDDKHFATAHNYVLAYTRSCFETRGVQLPEEYVKDYKLVDTEGRRHRLQGLRKRGTGAKRSDRPKMYYPFYGNAQTGEVAIEPTSSASVEIWPRLSDGTDGRWRWGKATAAERLSELMCQGVGVDARLDVFQRDYLDGKDGPKRIKPKTVWQGSGFANETGTLEVKNIFDERVFDNPKPIGLLKYCLDQAVVDGDIVLDFFAGSGTTGDAVYRFNDAHETAVRFILVQLPEKTGESTTASKIGFDTISEITAERLRRVAGGHGFKTFKLDSSNIQTWDADYATMDKNLFDAIDNIKSGRTQDDVLYELLLKYGLDLAIPVETRTIHGKTVFIIGAGALVVCLDKEIGLNTVKGIAALKAELTPQIMKVVFKDAGFADDVVKTNTVQILKQAGVDDVKSL